MVDICAYKFYKQKLLLKPNFILQVNKSQIHSDCAIKLPLPPPMQHSDRGKIIWLFFGDICLGKFQSLPTVWGVSSICPRIYIICSSILLLKSIIFRRIDLNIEYMYGMSYSKIESTIKSYRDCSSDNF